MNRLQQCIDALEAFGSMISTRQAITLVTRILSAEPTPEEIERAAQAIFESDMQCISKNNPRFKYERRSRMTLGEMASVSGRAALLTAFPQQEKL